MISDRDCVALCGLSEHQVAAIAEHEHVPAVAAAALGSYLLNHDGGEKVIRRMLVDDIHDALDCNRVGHAAELFMALTHFLNQHPRAMEGLDPD